MYEVNGFGTLEQRVNERSREDFTQFDVSYQSGLGKLLPKMQALSDTGVCQVSVKHQLLLNMILMILI